jgi:hypothetical protein
MLIIGAEDHVARHGCPVCSTGNHPPVSDNSPNHHTRYASKGKLMNNIDPKLTAIERFFTAYAEGDRAIIATVLSDDVASNPGSGVGHSPTTSPLRPDGMGSGWSSTASTS